jgi:hypothetical protein
VGEGVLFDALLARQLYFLRFKIVHCFEVLRGRVQLAEEGGRLLVLNLELLGVHREGHAVLLEISRVESVDF